MEGFRIRDRLRRRVTAAGASVVLAALMAAPALATGPIRIEGELSESYMPPGCDFPLLVENPKGTQDVLVWEYPDGSVVIRIVGPWFVRLTNLDSGESMNVSLAGPAHIEIDDEFTFLTTGRWLFHPAGGEDGVWIVSGLADTSDGAAAGLDNLRGHAIDVCAALS
jgi:hypothetical protein